MRVHGSRPLKVLVAHGNRELLMEIDRLLQTNGFVPVLTEEGVKALQLLEIERPIAAVIDVALPGYLGFEICSFVKEVEELKDIKLILVASVYDKTRYKRTPSSLYGADDYVEIHHIRDKLIPKIRNLIGIESEGGVTLPLQKGKGGYEEKEIERLSRIIVADILLYNEDRLREGIISGKVHELLREEIEEGWRYLEKRIPGSAKCGKDFIGEILDEFIEKKRREMGLLR